MLRLFLENCKWGTDFTEEGMQLNILDEESGLMIHIPFDREALIALENMVNEAKENNKTTEEKTD